MSFSDMNTISMCSPVYVAPMAWIFLKEKWSVFQICTILVTIVGVVLVTRPTFIFPMPEGAVFTGTQNAIGAGFSLVAALGLSTAILCVRKCPKTPATIVNIWFSFYSIIFGLILIPILMFGLGMEVGMPITMSDWVWLNVSGLFGVLNQCFFVWSLKLEEAGVVALIRTFDIVMAFVFQVAFLQQPVFWTSIVGAVVVFGTVAVTCMKKLFDSRPDMARRVQEYINSLRL